MEVACRVELFGGLCAVAPDGRRVSRFRTAKTAALLAFLAFHGTRPHPRETLCDLFWPDADDARNSLSKALGSLRGQLEPPGVPMGAVLVADRVNVGINHAVCRVDTAEFDAALSRARRATREASADALPLWTVVASLYGGELLPGLYDDWVVRERGRLQEEFLHALEQMASLSEAAGDGDGALHAARLAINTDPARESAHQTVIRLLMVAGDVAGAQKQFRELERALLDELGEMPSAASRTLLGTHLPASPHSSASRVPPETGGLRATRSTPLPLRTGEPGRREGMGVGSFPHRERGDTSQASPKPTAGAPLVPHTSAGGGAQHDQTGRLPLTLTRFFGREDELARLEHTLTVGGTRLLTVTGPGGTGKTRLATEAARRLLPHWPGRLHWASLAEATDAPRLLEAILAAVDGAGERGPDLLAQIAGALGSEPSLLILDNFEQLLDAKRPDDAQAAVRAVQSLLARAPALSCLVTSRQRLGLPGEREFSLPPLPAPPSENNANPAELLGNPCVALFVDRAQNARPDFQISLSNAADIARLCDGLDGVPLAIELAAARAQVLSPAQMLGQMERRFQFLVGRARGTDKRHQTIQNAVEWSYDLLAPEAAAFAQTLSVFRGGWTLDAAEAVCREPLALDLLALLVECSLILSDDAPEGLRFRQLETLRQYGDFRLPEDARAAARARHATFFCGLSEQAEPRLSGPEQGAWLARLDTEHDNLRAALGWAREAPNADVGLRLGWALWRFWYVRGHLDEGRAHLSAMLAAPASHAAPPLSQARACVAAGSLARMQGDHAQARLFLERGIRLARASGDADLLALTLNGLGLLESDRGDGEAATVLFAESLALRRLGADVLAVATSLNNLGTELLALGRCDDARPLLEESVALRRQQGDVLSVAHGLNNLGLVMQGQGDWNGARGAFEDSLATCRLLGDAVGMAAALDNLTETALLQKDSAFGRVCCAEALALREASGDLPGLATSLEWLAALAAQGEETSVPESKGMEAHPARAATLWAAAAALRERLAAPLPPPGQAVQDGYRDSARAACPSPLAWERAERLGRAMTPAQAVAFARADL